MRVKGILFDLDGVLIKSMEDNFLAWANAFEQYGESIQKEEYFILEGMKLIEIAKTLSVGKNIAEEDFIRLVEFKNQFYRKNHTVNFYEGVMELIDFLKSKGMLIAIVSASPHEKLHKTLPLEFLNKFDCLISGDDTEKGKPNPDPYLNAMKKLNLNPNESVVIENAPLGVKSAKAANAFCIAIGSTLQENNLSDADIFINEFKDLKSLELIKNI